MKSIKDTNDLKQSLDNYVSYSIRESLGIIILSFSEDEITIGAMNPNYVKVLEFITKLESEIKSLRRSNELIKSELEKTLRDQAQTHQLAVELRMQGL